MVSLKRPLAVVGFSMLLTVLCIILTDCTALAVFAVVFACICLVISVGFRFKGADTVFAFGFGIILASFLFLNAEYKHDKALTACGENRYVEAVVSREAEYSEKRNRVYVEATVKSVDSEKLSSKIRLSFPASADGVHNELKIGDRIKFAGVVYKTGEDSPEVHNSFSSEKIYLGAYSIKIFDITEPYFRPLTYYAALLRNEISRILDKSYSEEISGLINAFLTGDKSECPDWVYTNFKRAGVAHIMAVSGLHLSVWISLLFLLRKNNEKIRRLRFYLGILFIIIFAFMADFSPSVCRAALMSSLYLVGSRIKKSADALNSIGFALICMLVANPFVVFSISFQLSFACVFAIVTLAVPLCGMLEEKLKKTTKRKRIRKVLLYLLSSVIVSVSVSIVSFPISSYHFGYVSMVSPITNILIIPACAPFMISSVLFLVFSGVPFLCDFLHLITELLSKYMLFVTEDFSSFELSTISTDTRERSLWLVGALALAILLLLKRSNRKTLLRTASILTVFLTVFSLLAIAEKRADECKVKVLNTSTGSAAVLIYNGKGVLFGAAEDYYFADILADVVQTENIDLVVAVPVSEGDKEELEIISGDFEIENVLSEGESIALFSDAFVNVTENGAEITVKDKSIGVFPSDYLQVDENYDIIIRNDGIITSADGKTVSCEKQGHSFTIYVSNKKDVKVRREESWLNLMRKS